MQAISAQLRGGQCTVLRLMGPARKDWSSHLDWLTVNSASFVSNIPKTELLTDLLPIIPIKQVLFSNSLVEIERMIWKVITSDDSCKSLCSESIVIIETHR